MTDKELLELAAKAAGIELGRYDADPIGRCAGFNIPNTNVWWNPLTDDGDALRLAVKLDLLYGINTDLMIHYCTLEWQNSNANSCASIRRAIVRAAAELGRAMP